MAITERGSDKTGVGYVPKEGSKAERIMEVLRRLPRSTPEQVAEAVGCVPDYVVEVVRRVRGSSPWHSTRLPNNAVVNAIREFGPQGWTARQIAVHLGTSPESVSHCARSIKYKLTPGQPGRPWSGGRPRGGLVKETPQERRIRKAEYMRQWRERKRSGTPC